MSICNIRRKFVAILAESDNFQFGELLKIIIYIEWRDCSMRQYEIKKATKEDLWEILDLQYIAYQSEADLFGTQDIPPLKQTIDEVIEEYNNGVVLKMEDDNKIICSVRARCDNGTVYIGKLMVNPQYRKRGLGKRLLNEIEIRFPHCTYELFTSTLSRDNLRLYESVGYVEYKSKQIDDRLTFVYLKKR